MSRSSTIPSFALPDDPMLESISLHTVDQLSFHGQEPDIGPPFDHTACTGTCDSGKPQIQIFRRPWIARLRSYRQNRKNAWRTAMNFNILMTLAILILNASFLLIAGQHHGFSEGHLVRCPCNKAEAFAMLSHIVINIFGTLLLGASNYTMQILASPSRDDIDSAHSHGISLSIGVQSLRNLKFIGYTRLTLWIALAIASIPLHLLYNSTIFISTRTSAYLVAVTTTDFEQGAHFDLHSTNQFIANAPVPTIEALGTDRTIGYFLGQVSDPISKASERAGYEPPQIRGKDGDVLSRLQKKALNMELKNITNEECMKIYSEPFQVEYAHILAISSSTASNNSILWLDHSSSPDGNRSDWMCTYKNLVHSSAVCTVGGPVGVAESMWLLGLYAKHKETGWRVNGYPISRCLVEPADNPCLLRYNSNILIVVLIANFVKLVVMVATMFQYRQPALVTVGDALASFLERPDCTTNQMSFAENDGFDSGFWTTGPKKYSLNKAEFQRSLGASQLQWAMTAALLICYFTAGAVCLILVYDSSVGLDWVLSKPAKPNDSELGRGLPESILICLANLPQLALSFNYILCNRLMTCMAGAREWSMFAHQKKGLRTSQPKGSQRSTYWLQLPLKFSLPMMGASALLHYVTSQCIYFGSMKYYDYPGGDGKQAVLKDQSGLGYSRTAIHVLLILVVLAFGAIVVWGQRNNQIGIPPCGFSSAAISAACHPPAEEEEPHLKPVQWGAIPNDNDRDGVGHCSFSSGEVTMPLEGKMYI